MLATQFWRPYVKWRETFNKKNIWFRKTSLKLLKKNLVDHFSMSVDPLSIDNFTIQSEICEENEFLANIGLLSTTT